MLKKFAVAAALVALASSSYAAGTGSFYAGADVGNTKFDDFSGRKTSFGGFVGYQFNENVALEGGFRRLADFDVNYAGTNVGVTADQTALSVVGTLPVGNGFDIYGRLGYNHLSATGNVAGFSASDSTNKALYGVGVSFAFSPTVSARLEFQKPSSDSNNLSAGVSFKF